MKISTGGTAVVPHIVSTSLRYHLMKINENHCQSLDYKPLSTSSLLRVLEQCKFSQRRQITGLDNYTGDEEEGFRILETVLDKIRLDVEERKCLKIALNNPLSKDLVSVCDHNHDDICNDCENIFQCLDEFHDHISNKIKDETVKEERTSQ